MPATIAPFVSQRMGLQHAKEYMLSAQLFSAEKAHEMRLVDYIADHDFAIKLAESFSKNNLSAMQKTKSWLQALNPITLSTLAQAAELLATVRQKVMPG